MASALVHVLSGNAGLCEDDLSDPDGQDRRFCVHLRRWRCGRLPRGTAMPLSSPTGAPYRSALARHACPPTLSSQQEALMGKHKAAGVQT